MGQLFQAGRKRIIQLMAIMGFLSVAMFWTVVYRMYVNEIKEQMVFLTYASNSAKSIIEGIIIEEINLHQKITPDMMFEQMRYHLVLNSKSSQAFGKTGEVIIGFLEDDHSSFTNVLSFSRENQFQGAYLSLKSLVITNTVYSNIVNAIIGIDYRGNEVVEASESIPQLKLEIVAKIDLSEIQNSFIPMAIFFFLGVVILFGIAAIIIIRIGERIMTVNEIREQKYRTYIAYAPVGIILCDKDGQFLEVNDKASEIMGYDREELMSKSFSEIMPDKMMQVHENESEHIIYEMAQFFNADQKFININKEEFFLIISVVRLTHERYLIFINDMTARKELENRLTESEEKFRGLYASARDAIILGDNNGRVVLWNLAAEKTFGYSADEAMGKKISELIIPSKFKELHENAYHEFRSTGTGKLIDKNFEIMSINKAGKEFPIEMALAAIDLHGKWHSMAILRDITARKLSEKALQDSQSRLSVTLETSEIGIWDWDIKNDLWYASPTYFSMLGYEPEAGASSREIWLERVHPDDRQNIAKKIDQVLNGVEINYQYEARLLHADGSYRWVKVTGKVVESDVKWNPVRMLGTRMDITDQKQAQLAVLQREEEVKELVLHSPVAMIVDVGVDTDEKILLMNQQFTKLFGYTIEEIPDVHHWWPLAYPDEKYREKLMAEWLQKVKTAVQNHAEIEPMEVTVTCKDSSIKYVRISFASIGVKNIITFEDLTERKQAEANISASEIKFRTLYESSNDAIMLLDDKGFIDCNSKTLKMFACESSQDFLHKQPSQFSPITQPDGQYSLDLSKQYITTAFKNGSNQFEWIHSRLDGTEFPAEVFLTAMTLNGKPIIQASVRDITSRKLMESQLLQSSKMATLGEMATGIAHEINQPLTVIKMGSQLLERAIRTKHLSDDFLSDQADKFIRNIDRAIKIINHLRIFGRKVADEMVPYNINTPIGSSIEMVDNRLHHSLIKLNLELGDNLQNVLGEESSMEQVFINILLNAIDALLTMPDEYEKEISIHTTYDSTDDKVVVKIANNGPEIPKKIIDKVFEPFFTTKGPGKGTGLGLSISYGILQSHGGSISVENTENGPCFTIKLPAE